MLIYKMLPSLLKFNILAISHPPLQSVKNPDTIKMAIHKVPNTIELNLFYYIQIDSLYVTWSQSLLRLHDLY